MSGKINNRIRKLTASIDEIQINVTAMPHLQSTTAFYVGFFCMIAISFVIHPHAADRAQDSARFRFP